MTRSSLLACGLVLAGCVADDVDPTTDIGLSGEQEITLHDVTPLTISKLEPGEQLLVDLTVPRHVWRFLPAGAPIDFERVALVCPNGIGMTMAPWLEQRTGDLQLSLAQLTSGALVLTEPGSSEDAPGFTPGSCTHCYTCSDGAFMCFVICAGGDGESNKSFDGPGAGYLYESGGYVGPH
jgi:hypothetical protein